MQVIFTKLARTGLLGYRVLCPINCLTHSNLLFLLLSYNAVHPGPLLVMQSPQCRTGNSNGGAPVGSEEGKSTQGYLC